jgi:hypothetical protein
MEVFYIFSNVSNTILIDLNAILAVTNKLDQVKSEISSLLFTKFDSFQSDKQKQLQFHQLFSYVIKQQNIIFLQKAFLQKL